MANSRKRRRRLPGWSQEFLAHLPRLLIQTGGLAVVIIGCAWLVAGQPLGLALFLCGVDVMARPTARRLPRPGALTGAVIGVVEPVLRTRRGP